MPEPARRAPHRILGGLAWLKLRSKGWDCDYPPCMSVCMSVVAHTWEQRRWTGWKQFVWVYFLVMATMSQGAGGR
jgi:hypothetical protein